MVQSVRCRYVLLVTETLHGRRQEERCHHPPPPGATVSNAPDSDPLCPHGRHRWEKLHRRCFPTIQTQTDNLLLVGEAAGLVNPFNGEGVGFAMESGLMAAEVAAEALVDGELSTGRLAVFGRRLREWYLSLFPEFATGTFENGR